MAFILTFRISGKQGVTYWGTKGLMAMKYNNENKIIDLSSGGSKQYKELINSLNL